MKENTMRLSPSTLAIIDNPAPGKSWGFLRPEVCYSRHVLLVGTMSGTECIDADGLGLADPPASEDEEAVHAYASSLKQYLEGGIVDLESVCESVAGYVCRMSAPGYMDCTSWEYCETEADVLAFLKREAEDIADHDGEGDPDADPAEALAEEFPAARTIHGTDSDARNDARVAEDHGGETVYRVAMVEDNDTGAEVGYVVVYPGEDLETVAKEWGNKVNLRLP